MSIYFDFEVGKSGRRIRRAVESDKNDVDLIMYWTKEHRIFGEDVNIGALIELSVLSICMVNEEKEVVGFMALSDHPNVHSVDPSEWEYWIRNLFQRYYLSRNTLFIHFMCCIDSVTDFFMEEVLISVFQNDAYLHYIIIVLPSSGADDLMTRHAAFKKRNFYKFLPKPTEEKVGCFLLTANRKDFCPKLKIRRAVEEDNDDVVEILDKATPRLKNLYGEYYISELIGRHPQSERKILVGDIQGRAVTVMCLNTEINYKKLHRIYELRSYNGLIAATPLEKELNKRGNDLLTKFGDPILKGKWNPYELHHKESVHVSSHQANIEGRFRCQMGLSREKTVYIESVPNSGEERKSEELFKKTTNTQSKVNFKENSKMRQSFEHIKYDSDDFSDRVYNTYSPTTSLNSILSVANLLDDDPFDYDIVNIDENWLTITSSECRPTISTNEFPKQPVVRTSKKAIIYNKAVEKERKQPNKNAQIVDKKASIPLQGTRNAFMIELFALREDIDERHSFDMLEAAFEFMKDYEYCIIRVPTVDRSFYLLQHFCFVPTRKRVCCDYALYVAHRSSIMGMLRVRAAEIIDIPAIANLLHPLDGKDILSTVQDMISNKTVNQAYVFSSGMSVIGIGVIEPPEEIDFLRARFNLDSYQIHKYRYKGNGVDAGFATIKLIITYPVFEAHYRFFARELMRFSGSNTLMYITAYRSKWAVYKGNAMVSAMVPLVPKKFVSDSDSIRHLKRIGAMSHAIVPFSAWFIGARITSISKVTVNTKIVIVGGSRTAFGFLQALLFGQTSTYLTFTNVTLISKHGLPYMRRSKSIAESMFRQYYNNADKYLKSIPYTYYINVIQGSMAEINLQAKYVALTSGSKYQYDLLFLFFGKQYQHPSYMMHLLEREKEYKRRAVPEYYPLDMPRFSDTEIQITTDDIPENVFIINHILDAHKALEYIKTYVWQANAKVIVYGASIHAYLCINALLAIDVAADNIIFVEPFPPEEPYKTRVPEFCNPNVDQTIKEVINNLKITAYRSYYFQKWIVDVQNRITRADFLSYADYLQLDCAALFYYGKRGINMRAFIAIHKSGLPYDGGIIIDGECRTRDRSVYAAGTHTRYHRRYYADAHGHKYFDTYEVGFKLGTRIRNNLDPLFTETKRPTQASGTDESQSDSSSGNQLPKVDYENPNLMDLRKPKVTYCVLPGGFKYLQVRSPGLKLPHHYLQSLDYNGYVMETFKRGYFNLHLNKNLYVDGITCLKPANYSLEKFKNLYGLSVMVLKNVHLRYSTNEVNDFYEYFQAPWAFFLYHDQVDDLFAMSKELFPKGHNKGITIKEALSESSKGSTTAIRDKFKRSPYVESITDYVIEWLSQNDIILPMYLQPYQSTNFEFDSDVYPMHFKEKNTDRAEKDK